MNKSVGLFNGDGVLCPLIRDPICKHGFSNKIAWWQPKMLLWDQRVRSKSGTPSYRRWTSGLTPWWIHENRRPSGPLAHIPTPEERMPCEVFIWKSRRNYLPVQCTVVYDGTTITTLLPGKKQPGIETGVHRGLRSSSTAPLPSKDLTLSQR